MEKFGVLIGQKYQQSLRNIFFENCSKINVHLVIVHLALPLHQMRKLVVVQAVETCNCLLITRNETTAEQGDILLK